MPDLIDQVQEMEELERQCAIHQCGRRAPDVAGNLRPGVCHGCGTDIPLERLRVLPQSTHCVKCQSLLDRSYELVVRGG